MERILQWWKNYRFSIADPPIISMEGLYPLLLLLVLSLLAVFFHLVRILFNAPVDFSMDWNLFLSWIPLMTAFFINNITRRFGHLHFLVIISSLFWLAFFPNAPYMITDISHLSIDLKRDLTWHDTIMLILLCGSKSFQWPGFTLLDPSDVAQGFQKVGQYHFFTGQFTLGGFWCLSWQGKTYEQLGYYS